ncbi:lipase family protein [Bacillus seohaeanensis]|uniref:Fungal lipase-type domain-containing protein n=1 Tax=Bacillus seohaeanensis TaxID=284580 RepID=A0ABW5RQ78_9BACI
MVVRPTESKAGYSDNYNRLYYDLSRLVYSADYIDSYYSIKTKLNNLHGANKYKVISAVDVNDDYYHPMSTSSSTGDLLRLDSTGFKAMAVVAEGSKKLFIAFSGTDTYWDFIPDLYDANAARVTLSSKAPGQNYQAQLFTNYIYEAFPRYQDYKWYFTGHSLGGWLATKTYLDIRSANWLIPNESTFEYGGPINKSISGVYTFNPLPIHKNQIPSIQWNANKRGVYNSDVKNLYINNEWLNGVYDMNTDVMDYIGTQGSITNEHVLHHSYLDYRSKGAYIDIVDYARQALTAQKEILYTHSLSRIKPYVGY